MSRLIDTDTKTFPTPYKINDTEYAKGWDSCLNSISQQPTVEAEPVVHCKNCIYRPVGHVAHNVSAPVIDGVEYRVCPCLCEDPQYSTNPPDNFFCAKGSIGV